MANQRRLLDLMEIEQEQRDEQLKKVRLAL